MNSTHNASLSLTPLGPGDLIDRAVRFYRKTFITFVLIALPPVVIGTVLSLLWIIALRQLFPNGANAQAVDAVVYYLISSLGTASIWIVETVATLAAMGGASRNFVRHLLFGEKMSFAETYRNTWQRIGGLVGASVLLTLLLGTVGVIIFYLGLLGAALLAVLIFAVFGAAETLATILVFIVGAAVFVGAALLFLLVASRFAYVPQVMLVEGRGVFASLGRSVSLARGNMRRFSALLVFTIVAAYSALAILYVPLGWYAWIEGIDILGLEDDIAPMWFAVASQLVSQLSIILLSPIWMVGLCLLYVDERVRHEGYDIELMAARTLGDIPDVPVSYINPLQPAISHEAHSAATSDVTASHDLLGLK